MEHEIQPRKFVAAFSERTDVHAIRDWCWLGTARDDGELAALLEAPVRPQFDIDVTRLLLKRHTAGALALVPVPAAAARTHAPSDDEPRYADR